MIRVSFEFETTDAAAAFLRRLDKLDASNIEKGVNTQEPSSKTEPVRRGRPPKNTVVQPVPEVAKPQEAPKLVPEPATPIGAEVTEADVQKALEEVFNVKKIETARALLSHYGVKRLAELDRSRFAEFVAHAKKVLAGEPV